MMMVVRCTNCGKSGQFPFRITWEYKKECCQMCNYDRSSYVNYEFCCAECMNKWVKEFMKYCAKGKHKWYVDSDIKELSKKQKINYMKQCTICKLHDWQIKK